MRFVFVFFMRGGAGGSRHLQMFIQWSLDLLAASITVKAGKRCCFFCFGSILNNKYFHHKSFMCWCGSNFHPPYVCLTSFDAHNKIGGEQTLSTEGFGQKCFLSLHHRLSVETHTQSTENVLHECTDGGTNTQIQTHSFGRCSLQISNSVCVCFI